MTAPVLIRAHHVVPVKIDWLWHHRIPLGALTLLEGDPGVLKSTLCLDIAARVSTGTPFPDGAPCEVGGVVIISAEDSIESTLVPRLNAAGADLERITFLAAVERADGTQGPFTLPTHIGALLLAVEDVEARLVIIDPLAAYHDDAINPWKDSDVRKMLLPLVQLSEAERIATLTSRHWHKGGTTNAKHKGGGSIAYTGAARAVYCVSEEPGDETGQHFILADVKPNLVARQPSLRYRGEVAPAGDGVPEGTVRIQWCGESAYRAPDLTEDADKRAMIEEVIDVLRELLGDGHGHPEQQVWQEVRRRTGTSLPTYKRARRRIGVKATPAGWQGPSMLTLPTATYDTAEREGMQEG